MRKLMISLVGLAFAFTPLAVIGGSIAPANAGCVSPTFTGDDKDGTWSTEYNPGCNGNTKGTVWASWSTYRTADDHMWIKYDLSVQAGAIAGNDCIEVAIDWESPLGGHGDAQIMRNCKENSTRTMDAQYIDTNKHGGVVPESWYIQRLQVSTYNPDAGTVRDKDCPSQTNINPPGSETCSDWNPNASWSSVGAKIRRRTNAGTDQQNDPQWPAVYDIDNMESANIYSSLTGRPPA